MSLPDSLRLTASTVISNAAGASLGMEAGYTQFGSGMFSSIASYFRLRRADHRVFVTAGSAAAIAAAFNAPLAGAFYGYELILGSYMPNALAPVAVAAVCGALSQRFVGGAQPLFAVTGGVPLDVHSYVLFGVMGVFAAAVAIAAMIGVTWTERSLKNSPIPDWLRPCTGGIVLSAIAWFYPQVLGSGHGAIQYYLARVAAALAPRIAACRQIACLGRFGRFRISRRTVQFVAVSRLSFRRRVREMRWHGSIRILPFSTSPFCWWAWARLRRRSLEHR